MRPTPQAAHTYTESELQQIYQLWQQGKSVKAIAHLVGRTPSGLSVALRRIKILVSGQKLNPNETIGPAFERAAQLIRASQPLEFPETVAEPEAQPTLPPTQQARDLDKLADYLDEVKRNLAEHAVALVEAVDADLKVELDQVRTERDALQRRVETLETELKQLKPVVEAAKHESTRSILERMLNTRGKK